MKTSGRRGRAKKRENITKMKAGVALEASAVWQQMAKTAIGAEMESMAYRRRARNNQVSLGAVSAYQHGSGGQALISGRWISRKE